MWILTVAVSASAQEVRRPKQDDEGVSRAYEHLIANMKLLWTGNVLTYQEKIDLGRLYEQLHSTTMAERTVTLAMVEEKVRLLNEIICEDQWDRARKAIEVRNHNRLRKSLVTFSMEWPANLAARWDQALLEGKDDIQREQAAFGRLGGRVAADVRNRTNLHIVFKPVDQDTPRVAFTKPAAAELNIRALAQDPYMGYRFDTRILADPALDDSHRLELRTRILNRILDRRISRDPLVYGWRQLALTHSQMDRVDRALKDTTEELRAWTETFVILVLEDANIHKWFRDALYSRLDLDTLLTPGQRKALGIVATAMKSRAKTPFSFREIEADKLEEIGRLVEEFEARIEGIPLHKWGRDMQYQEAKLDLDLSLLRIGMNSKKMSVARRGEMAKSHLKTTIWDLGRIFTSPSRGLLNSWPVILPGGLPGNSGSSESITPEQWVRIYQVFARPGVLDELMSGQLLKIARLIQAQAGKGQAMELLVLANYKTYKALYAFTEGLFDDPLLTPLQKLLIFEPYWNNFGPFSAYFYALDLDADILDEKIKAMRSLLMRSTSWPPDSQLVYSVGDIAKRARQSVSSVHRWADLSGAFTQEEMKVLKTRKEALLARIDSWADYVPPDPNLPTGPSADATVEPIR